MVPQVPSSDWAQIMVQHMHSLQEAPERPGVAKLVTPAAP